MAIIRILFMLLLTIECYAVSDSFPPYEDAPAYTTYFADGTANNVYHIDDAGSDSTGTGTFANPWASLAGSQGTLAAGDLILFHEGDYTEYTNGAGHRSTNRNYTSGTDSDRIVIMAANKYPTYSAEDTPLIDELDWLGMTLHAYQVLDGITFRGGLSLYNSNITIQNCEFYNATAGMGSPPDPGDGNPNMIIFPAESPYAQNTTIINNSFHDSDGTLAGGHGRVYAIIMFESNTSDGGATWNGNYTDIKYNKFYNFNGATNQTYCIYVKDLAHGVEAAYNRFYNNNAYAFGGWGQGTTNVGGYDIHHNLVYNSDGLCIYWGETIGAKWRSNVVIDDGYTDTAHSTSWAAGVSNGMLGLYNDHSSDNVWGEVYDNVLYTDHPGYFLYSSSSLTGWWEWVDYNAYANSTQQALFANEKSATTNWQTSDVLTANAITVDGNYFATIADDSDLIDQGRFGDTIGGFTFGEATAPIVAMVGSGSTVSVNTSVTIHGTATATSGRTITGITSPGLTVTCDDGTCDEIEEPFSAASGTLSSGLNSFIFTATDSESETGQDTFEITYTEPEPASGVTSGGSYSKR